jgi:5-methyltetrahydrofolate--homocysteine methyltransferase
MATTLDTTSTISTTSITSTFSATAEAAPDGATLLAGRGRAVAISQEAPTTIIGERCNALGYRSVMRAVRAGRFSVLAERARAQEAAGATVVNCNVVGPDIDEPAALVAAVKAMSAAVEIPLSLDVGTPEALLAALAVCPGRPLVNSINGTEARLDAFVPIITANRLPVVVMLAEDDGGTPAEPEARFRLAERLANRLTAAGVPLHDLIFDPVLVAAPLEPEATLATLETTRLIRERLHANVLLGASNVSFGLPERRLVDTFFIPMGIACGANVLLTDPTIPSLRRAVLASDVLAGRDAYGQRYLQAFRAGVLVDQAPPPVAEAGQ